jgi:biopolymer transport protein ExbB
LIGADTAGALRLCAAQRSPVERVLFAGLMACVDRRRAEIAMHEARVAVEPLLRRRLSVLSTLASLACLVGLLGTIDGLIGGFHCVATISATQRSASIARELGIAMNTSAFGILVAVLLLCAKVVLVNASEKLAADLASCSARFLDVVGVVREPPPLRRSPYRSA